MGDIDVVQPNAVWTAETDERPALKTTQDRLAVGEVERSEVARPVAEQWQAEIETTGERDLAAGPGPDVS